MWHKTSGKTITDATPPLPDPANLLHSRGLTTLATIFVPLSFVASLLGMNVRQLSAQNSISISMYFVIAIPLTAVSPPSRPSVGSGISVPATCIRASGHPAATIEEPPELPDLSETFSCGVSTKNPPVQMPFRAISSGLVATREKELIQCPKKLGRGNSTGGKLPRP